MLLFRQRKGESNVQVKPEQEIKRKGESDVQVKTF